MRGYHFHSYRPHRFCFMNQQGGIADSSAANCAGDDQACARAIQMFIEQDRNPDIDVWDRARLVFRFP
jgi:hypothetical protein